MIDKSGWRWVKFGDVVVNLNLTAKHISNKTFDKIIGLDHIDSDNVHITRWDENDGATSFNKIFQKGQTLFGKRRAYQKKIAIAEFEGICSGDILVFDSKDESVLLPSLIPFICRTDAFYKFVEANSQGSLSPRVSFTALSQYEFSLPPVEDQKRIAELLWAADETAVAYKKSMNAIDDTLRIYRNKIYNNNNSYILIGEVLDRIIAGKSVTGVEVAAKKDEYGVLKVSAITDDYFNEFGNKRLIDLTDFKPQFSIKNNSLLITRCNTTELVGRVVLTEQDYPNLMLCDKTLELVTNTDKIRKEFLLQMLRSKSARLQIESKATGTGGAMKNLSQGDISAIKIPNCSLAKQDGYLEVFRKIDSCRKSNLEMIINNTKMFKRLISQYLEGAN